VPSPLSIKLAPIGNVEVVSVGLIPSGSEADTPKVKRTFSSVFCAPIEASTGSRLIWLTVIVTISKSVAELSSTAVNVIS